MQLRIAPGGTIHCIYGEALPLNALGQMAIQRASHVEPTDDGRWTADLTPVAGPLLGPFGQRSEALAAELRWLETHWLKSASG
jgi:hypothetical protein